MRVRMDHVASQARSTVDAASLGADEVFHYSIPTFDETRDGAYENPVEIGSNKTLLRGDELLIAKLNPRKQRILRAKPHKVPTVCSGEFVVLRPHGVNPRYLEYLLLGEDTRQYLSARVQSVTRSQQRVRPEDITKMWFDLPPLSAQRRVADYLDRETSRIDALIAAKGRMVELLEEHDQVELSRLVTPGQTEMAHLRYFATVQGGVTVDAGRDGGPNAVTRPYLRVANVQAGRLDLTDVTEITVPRALAARSTLRTSDVLMTEGGDIDKLGRGTVWDGQLDGCLHQNHIFAVRPNPRLLDCSYLALITQSSHARAHFESTGVQSTNLASTSSSKIMDLPVPVLPIRAQREIVAQWNHRAARTASMRLALTTQVGLLEERRQALITAAVTGQLHIPEAA